VPGLGRGLSSAGLAFKLSQALVDPKEPERLDGLLDLAALGTLADCSPLLGDNRILIAAGLSRLVDSRRPGLRRLCEATGTARPEPEQVLRRLVPRLNASGRLGDPAAIWHLLRAEPAEAMEEWLEAAETAHARTKELHRRVIGQAQEQVNRLHFRDQYVVVVSGVDWPQGLMGPLASQIAQRYGRPAIAIALGERQGTGSGRSIPLFNLLAALQACETLLVRFGGHAQACGLTLDRQHLEPFRARVNEQARASLGREGLLRTRAIDLELPLAAVEPGWVGELERLAPFGQGNPRPTVAFRRLRLERRSARTAVLSDGARQVAARGMVPSGPDGERYDVAASPSLAGGELVLTVTEVRPAQLAAPGAASGTAL
jgi:single-stranded-DNA-specific exonuclease